MDMSAVSGEANGLQPFGGLPLANTMENCSFLIQSVGSNENSDRLTNNLLSLIAKEPLCAVIPCLNDTVKVLCCDRIARILDDSGEFGSRLLRFALLGYVTENKDNARQCPIGSEDRRTTVINCNLFSTPADQNCVIGQLHHSLQTAHFLHRVFDHLMSLLIENPEDLGEWLASGLIQRPPGQLLSHPVHQLNQTVCVGHNHCIPYTGDCRVKPVLLLLKCPCRAAIDLAGINNGESAYQVEGSRHQGLIAETKVVLWNDEKHVR